MEFQMLRGSAEFNQATLTEPMLNLLLIMLHWEVPTPGLLFASKPFRFARLISFSSSFTDHRGRTEVTQDFRPKGQTSIF
jgi:hypothetical protein